MTELAASPHPAEVVRITFEQHQSRTQRVLLGCGILYSVFYVATDFVASSQWTAYSYSAQTISELSAIGAPTLALWNSFGAVAAVLLLAFASGVGLAAGRNRALRVTAVLLACMVPLGIVWAFFPMHQRGAPTTTTDTMHVMFAGVQVVLTLAAIGFTAAAFRGRFRIYAIATLAVLLAAGTGSFLYAPRLAEQLPTPGLGILERVNVDGYLLWLVALAVRLRSSPTRPQASA